jgi:hypothetical protein
MSVDDCRVHFRSQATNEGNIPAVGAGGGAPASFVSAIDHGEGVASVKEADG